MGPSDILTSVRFLVENELYKSTKPYEIIGLHSESIPDHARRNTVFETVHTLRAADLRLSKEIFTLETAGFCWLRQESQHLQSAAPFMNTEAENGTVRAFLDETMNTTRHILGAGSVFIYDWRVMTSHHLSLRR